MASDNGCPARSQATLSSQGRSVGVCVVGALQDPRKDVINLRNLFPTRVAMRLDESDQVDMVLGDGARDRGALADLISPLPEVGAGVAYVRLETSPDPVRVRAAYVSYGDIHAMADACTAAGGEGVCPCCGNGLTLLDGPWGLRFECRLCGHNETLTADQAADWR